MLFYLMIWPGLAISVMLLGLGILRISSFVRLNDPQNNGVIKTREIVLASMWMGCAGYGGLFPLLGLFMPVSLNAGLGLLILPFLTILDRKIRIFVYRIFLDLFADRKKTFRTIFLYVSSVAPVFYMGGNQITLFDTAYYHLPLARIMGEYGAVKGLVTLHQNFGQTSSWFVMAAPGTVGGEFSWGAATANTFISGLAAIHAFISIRDLALKKARIDVAISAIGFSMVLVMAARWGMISSLSPDLPVMLLCVAASWAISLSGYSRSHTDLGVTASFFISAFAFSIKISALPLLVTSTFFGMIFFWESIYKLWEFVFWGSWLLIPTLILNLLASGCVAYPVQLSCFQLPWTPDPGSLNYYLNVIKDAARGGGRGLLETLPLIEKFLIWLSKDKSGAFLTIIMIIISLPLVLKLLLRQIYSKKFCRSQLLVLILSLSGAIFVTLFAPTGRFIGGYTAVIVGLSFFAFQPLQRGVLLLAKTGLLSIGVILALMLAYHSGSASTIRGLVFERMALGIYPSSGDGWILPRKLVPFDVTRPDLPRLSKWKSASPPFSDIQHTDGSGICWAAPAPCIPNPSVLQKVRYQDLKRGVAAGFRFQN